MWTIPQFWILGIFPGIGLVLMIYVRYYHKIWGSYITEIDIYLVFRQFLKNIWDTYSMYKYSVAWIVPYHELRKIGGANLRHFMQNTEWILKYATIKVEWSFLYFFMFCWSKANFILIKIQMILSKFKFQVRLIDLGQVSWCSVSYTI